jgi:hypothetical protein
VSEKAYEDHTFDDAMASCQVMRKHDAPMSPLTVEEVRAEVEIIRLGRFDAEQAHGREDHLHQRVLSTIALGVSEEQARVLARAALETVDIDFPRWCA